jgi:hypothetical protein
VQMLQAVILRTGAVCSRQNGGCAGDVE